MVAREKQNRLDNLKYAVGRRVAELRVARGETQEQMAAALGVFLQHVQRIESGRQNLALSSLLMLADHFEVQVQDLLATPQSLEKPVVGRPKKNPVN